MRNLVTFLIIATVAFAGCREDKKSSNNNNNNNANNTNNDDTIYMVQDASHQHFVQDGDEVVLSNKVVTAVDKYGNKTGSFWISEPNGGAFSGVQVYNTDTTSAWWGDLEVGDLVTVHGRKMEYSYLDPDTNEPLFDDPLTEITEAQVTVLGSGTPLTPTDITASDLNTVETGEKWEGVLVRLTNVRVSDVSERDGRLEVKLGGSTKAQDDLADLASVNEGVCLSRLTGVVTYFFDYYLMPRSAADIEVAANDGDCAEIVDEICDNELDDDNNGFTDCDDWACTGNVACPAKVENSDALCGDGLDNDEDTLTDCADPSCYGHPDVTVCIETDCTDGADNDGNGYTDCEDFDCSENAACIENCTDGTDNDGNGYVDCDDYDCGNDPACADDFEQNCTDGISNDGDQYVDCRDFDCADDPVCTETNCADGIDNNGDGHIDCEDWDCLYTDPACAEGREITNATCSDGIDQDGDGYFDCRDYSCQQSPLVTICESTPANCADGVDNDGNGFVDCADFSCRKCDATDPSKDFVISTCPRCVHE